jgi:HPt (histidine-containing phosphotransfer) domain-containing protein
MISWPRVRELRSEVGEDAFDEVVALFLEEVEDALARLADSQAGGTLGEDLHFLKGSALSLGFEDFSARCQEAERLCATGQDADVALDDLTEGYAASKAAFMERLDAETAA